MNLRSYIRNFRRGLLANYQTLAPMERRLYRWLVRPFWNEKARTFFEGIADIPGQLYRAERRALYDALIGRAPHFAFEIGTFNGAGSTFFLAQGFASLGRGRLVTLEIDPIMHAQACALYDKRLPAFRPYIEFLLGGNPESFLPYLQKAGAAEFVFLDGAENAEQSLSQFRFFEPWFRPGSIVALHDWKTEKMRLLKEVIQDNAHWQLLSELGSPESIGFVIYQLKK